jgi:predicted enzyme related to lactoylglutathione lyase
MWKVCDGGWLYVVEDETRAGHGLVAVAVPDLDRVMDETATRGIKCPAIEHIPGVGRKASITDPEGNTVALIQVDETN